MMCEMLTISRTITQTRRLCESFEAEKNYVDRVYTYVMSSQKDSTTTAIDSDTGTTAVATVTGLFVY